MRWTRQRSEREAREKGDVKDRKDKRDEKERGRTEVIGRGKREKKDPTEAGER